MAKKTKKKNQSTANLTNALLYILVGLLFCIFQSGMMGILFSVVGALLIAKGVLDILAKNVTVGVISAVAGIAVILLGWNLVGIALLVLGVVILIKSIQNILDMLKRKYTLMELIGAILAAVIGVLLIANGWGMVDWLFIVIGVALIVDGAIILIKTLQK